MVNEISYLYEIYFPNTNYKYVGSTSQHIYKRYIQHFNLLKLNKHINIKMQNVYNKYKIKPKITILETHFNITNEDLFKREQVYIDNEKYNLNLCKIAGKPVVPKIKILQYDLNGDFIREWDSATDAGLKLKIHDTSIRNNIYGLNKSAGKFIWKLYTKNYNLKIEPLKRNKSKLPFTGKQVSLYNLDGDLLFTFKSIKECSKFLNKSVSCVSQCLSKKVILNNLFLSNEIKDKIDIPVKVLGKFTLSGILIKKFGNVIDAANEANKPNSNLYAHLNNKQKVFHGFKYKWINE